MDLGINFEVVDEKSIIYDPEILTEEMKRRAMDIEDDSSYLDKQDIEGRDSNQ